MRADGGRVPWLERHLDRLERSAAALGLSPVPARAEVREGVERALAAAGTPSARVRVTLSPRPTLLVEVTPEPPHPPLAPEARAIAIHGAWLPGNDLAEHKTLSYGAYRRAQARAAAAGADHALLLDADGRLGEAAVGNAFAVLHGAVVTAPVRGLLPGVARAIVAEVTAVREEALEEPVWRDRRRALPHQRGRRGDPGGRGGRAADRRRPPRPGHPRPRRRGARLRGVGRPRGGGGTIPRVPDLAPIA